MTARSLLLALVLLLAGPAVQAAGFDCDKAGSPVEKLICSDEALSRLDTRLGRAYALASHDALWNVRPALVAEQKAWLHDVRDRCAALACLASAYQARLPVLARIKTSKTTAEYVTEEQELISETGDFQRSLHEIGVEGSLSCPVMVRLLVELPSGHDLSYGGVCQLTGTRARTVLICNDTLVGKLTVAFQPPGLTGAAAADFASDNCPPGG